MRARLRVDRGRGKKLAPAWLFARSGGWSNADLQCGQCKRKRLYLMRNCRHFPELIQIGRTPCWTPRAKEKEVQGYRNSECPTSYITPESVWILELVNTHTVATRDTGATLFGPDSGKWPAWWTDALVAVASARADWDRTEMDAK